MLVVLIYTWTFPNIVLLELFLSLGDTMTLTVALLTCLLGYGEVNLWLQKESKNENSWVTMEDNPYKSWIDDYSGEIYQKAVKEGLGTKSSIFYFLTLCGLLSPIKKKL